MSRFRSNYQVGQLPVDCSKNLDKINTDVNPMDDTDDTVMYGSCYALVSVLLIFLDYTGVPTESDFDVVAYWCVSLVLATSCLVLLGYTLDPLGKALLPDGHEAGIYRTYIGAIFGMHIAIIYAAVSHRIDDKNILYQVFWMQVLALPGAYIAAKYLGDLIDGRKEWLWKIGAYRLVNLMLWLDMQNIPIAEEGEPPEKNQCLVMAWALGLFVLVLLDVFFLIESIVQDFAIRSARNPKAQVLLTIGIVTGVGIVLTIMIPLELKFHLSEDRPWVYFILVAKLGALPGAHLIGNSAWLAKIYAGRQPTLPGYSKISEEEGRV